jgi:UPF0755 protein
MKNFGKILLVLFSIIIIVGIAAVILGLNYYNKQIENGTGNGEIITVSIPEGSTTTDIAAILEKNELIESELIFRIYIRLNPLAEVLKAGEYELSNNMSIPEIVTKLQEGTLAQGVRVTLIEGYTAEEIVTEITNRYENSPNSQSELDLNTFKSIINNPDSAEFSESTKLKLSQTKPAGVSLEGFLYPDTYEFSAKITEIEIIEFLVSNFFSRLESEGIEITSYDTNEFYELLILASIVEKESFTNDERPIIASVFLNRLEIGMLLQSDATLNYETGNDSARLSSSELQIDSAYNTYKYPGLTPTPIANPRIDSILAVIEPADTNYYYFLHEQDGSGQVHFAETFAEHNKNVARYLD